VGCHNQAAPLISCLETRTSSLAGPAKCAIAAGSHARVLQSQEPLACPCAPLLCCSLAGLGLLPALDAAASRNLISPAVRMVPERVAVLGALAECSVPRACGVDLEPALRRFKWHPGLAEVDATWCVALLAWVASQQQNRIAVTEGVPGALHRRSLALLNNPNGMEPASITP
jgi:hypothetical protein